MRRLVCVALLAATLPLFAADPPAAKDRAAEKEALQKIGEFVGQWNASGTAKKPGRDSIWKETVTIGWKFEKDAAWLALSIKEGKFYDAGEIRYDVAGKAYTLTLTDKQKQVTTFAGDLKRGKLTFTRTDPATADVERVTMNTLADGARLVLKSEVQSKGKGLFDEQFSLAAGKEGVSLAGGGRKKPECVVTGGAGTMAVSYQGKTYYVCCSGCREEFEANPREVRQVSAPPDLITVRCEKCGKYQLAEASARGAAVPCLICKKPVPLPAPPMTAEPPNDDELLGLT